MSYLISKERYRQDYEALSRLLTYKTRMYVKPIGKKYAIPLSAAIKLEYTQLTDLNPTEPKKLLKTPREKQVPIIKDIMTKLTKSCGVTLAADTGTGKTFMSLYIALKLGMPTAFICPDSKLPIQWYNELVAMKGEKWADRNAACINLKAAIPDIMPYFVFIRDDLCAFVDMEGYELVVMDEIHMEHTERGVEALLSCCSAQRVIGCSATPKRTAEHDLNAFFTNMRVKVSHDIEFDLIVLDDGIVVRDDEYWAQTKIDPGAALEQYTRIEEKYSLIADVYTRMVDFLLTMAGDKKILIICKRINKCQTLAELINKRFAKAKMPLMNDKTVNYADSYTEDDTSYDGYAQFLIGTVKKVMTGFDQQASGIDFDERFDTVAVLDSMKDVNPIWQAFGRTLRSDKRKTFLWVTHPIRIYEEHTNIAIDFLRQKGGVLQVYKPYKRQVYV